ncbi:MAG: thioredoxin [Pseudomonadota bacterium]
MTTKPVNVTTASFEKDVKNAAEPVVVDFWAPWCGPCRQIGPVLEELAVSYAGQVKVAKVNVDEEPALAQAFGVRGIPTLQVLHNGKSVGQMVGFRGRAALMDLFADLAKLNVAN